MASAPRSAVHLFRAAAVFALLANIGGSIVAATHSGFECGNWPGCTADALHRARDTNQTRVISNCAFWPVP